MKRREEKRFIKAKEFPSDGSGVNNFKNRRRSAIVFNKDFSLSESKELKTSREKHKEKSFEETFRSLEEEFLKKIRIGCENSPGILCLCEILRVIRKIIKKLLITKRKEKRIFWD